MSNRPRTIAEDLNKLRARINRLRDRGLTPMEVVMSADTWEQLKSQHRRSVPGYLPGVISSREILGLRNKIVPGVQGAVIRYFGGADFPPDQAIEDGFIDLSKLTAVRRESVS